MGFLNTDNSPVGDKDKVLQQAEDKLLKARDLLKRCRSAIEDHIPAFNNGAGVLLSDITDFIGD